jgi:hypothetical protein
MQWSYLQVLNREKVTGNFGNFQRNSMAGNGRCTQFKAAVLARECTLVRMAEWLK